MKLIAILMFSGLMLAGLLVFSMDIRPAIGSGGTAFRTDVLPILVAGGCTGCHGGDGGLTVISVGGLLAGGDSGPAVIPGNADSSRLVQAIIADSPFGPRMPPEGPPLSRSSISTIRAWINEGARDD